MNSAEQVDSNRLTPRETEILRWIAEGKTVKETASIIGRSEFTVSKQLQGVRDKLDIHSIAMLTRHAIRIGLIEA